MKPTPSPGPLKQRRWRWVSRRAVGSRRTPSPSRGSLEPERGTEPGTSHTKSQQGLRIHGCGVPRSPGRPTACPPAQQSGTLLYEYAQPYAQCKVNVFSPVTAFTSVNGAAYRLCRSNTPTFNRRYPLSRSGSVLSLFYPVLSHLGYCVHSRSGGGCYYERKRDSSGTYHGSEYRQDHHRTA